jgi:hypothetical protein
VSLAQAVSSLFTSLYFAYPNCSSEIGLNRIPDICFNPARDFQRINPDAHATDEIAYTQFGIARQAWLEKKDVFNTQPWPR